MKSRFTLFSTMGSYEQMILKVMASLTILLILLPILIIPLSFLKQRWDLWQHIIDTMLGRLIFNTLILSSGVLTATFVIGVGAAWFVTIFEFPFRRFFSWALILPLAIPSYVLSFVFIALFDFSGPVQTYLRKTALLNGGAFLNIRSSKGVIFVMTLSLYPYVYLFAKNAFASQGKRILEVVQSLGYGRYSGFFKAVLPMARPFIFSGLMLVLMETLSDFGAVSIFNYDTFTTAIYKVWFGFFSIHAAAQLSVLLLILIFSGVAFERFMGRKMRYYPMEQATLEKERILLTGWAKWLVPLLLGALFLIAFALPSSNWRYGHGTFFLGNRIIDISVIYCDP